MEAESDSSMPLSHMGGVWEEGISYEELSWHLMGPTGSWTHKHYITGSHEHPLS